jgi:hypothetical protein
MTSPLLLRIVSSENYSAFVFGLMLRSSSRDSVAEREGGNPIRFMAGNAHPSQPQTFVGGINNAFFWSAATCRSFDPNVIKVIQLKSFPEK